MIPDTPFGGYPLPDSNCTFIPNQFFDLVLPHSSRGVVRLVGYLLRSQVAWSDNRGHPQEPQTAFTWKELTHAGIAHGAITATIKKAVAARLIRVQSGTPARPGQKASPGMVALNWDDAGPYTTDPEQFRGFFGGKGNRTWTPNAFFDLTLPQSPLSVLQVVGVVIRRTIGWQDRHGYRVQEVALSLSELQRLTGIHSRGTVVLALEAALAGKLLERRAAGVFGAPAQAARYGLCWEADREAVQKSDQVPSGPKISPDGGPITGPEAVQKSDQEHSKNQTGERSKNQTTSKTKSENVFQRHQTLPAAAANNLDADDMLVTQLEAVGVSRPVAQGLVQDHPESVIRQQLGWLPLRQGLRNPPGVIVEAIRNPREWDKPDAAGGERGPQAPRYIPMDVKAIEARKEAEWAAYEARKKETGA